MSGSLLNHAMFQQCYNKWLAIVSGVLLDIQCLRQLLFRYGAGSDKNLPDPHFVIEVVGADKVSRMEHQLALAFFRGDAKYSGFSCSVQQLNNINYWEISEIAFKGHLY
jgi:hypothetical protein